MKISIVIPNYNGLEILQQTLPWVIKTSGEAEIILVDDASTDGSVKEIKNQISKIKNTDQRSNIRLIQNEKNLGFSSTVNRGVREASGELIVLLNTDVSPERDFLKAALPHFADKSVFAIGFLDRSYEKDRVVLRGRGVGQFMKGFLVHARGEINKNNTLWASCGSGAFRRDIWFKLGGLEELYNPFYWEDIDISYRALKSGYKVLFEPKSRVKHLHEEGVIKRQYNDFKIKTIAYRNQIMFVWLNITDIKLLLEHFIFLPIHTLRSLILFDLPLIVGLSQAILTFPRIIQRRKIHTLTFSKGDTETLKYLSK